MATLTAIFASIFLFLSGPGTATAANCDDTLAVCGDNTLTSPGDRAGGNDADPDNE